MLHTEGINHCHYCNKQISSAIFVVNEHEYHCLRNTIEKYEKDNNLVLIFDTNNYYSSMDNKLILKINCILHRFNKRPNKRNLIEDLGIGIKKDKYPEWLLYAFPISWIKTIIISIDDFYLLSKIISKYKTQYYKRIIREYKKMAEHPEKDKIIETIKLQFKINKL